MGNETKTEDLSNLDPLFAKPANPNTESVKTEAVKENEFQDLHDLDPIFAKPMGQLTETGEPDSSVTITGMNGELPVMAPAAVGAGVGYLANKMAPPPPVVPQTTPATLANLERTLAGKLETLATLEAEYQVALQNHTGNIDQLKLSRDAAKVSLGDAQAALTEARDAAKSLKIPTVELDSEVRASGAKVEGASGTKNWLKQAAGQEHQVPEVIQNKATDMTKTSETGAKKLIDEDLKKLKKIQATPEFRDFELSGKGKTQVMLPSSFNQLSPEQIAAQEAVAKAELAHAKAIENAARAEFEFDKANKVRPKNLSKAEEAYKKAKLTVFELQAGLEKLKNIPIPSWMNRAGNALGHVAAPLGGAMSFGETMHGINELKAGHTKEGALALMGGVGGTLMLVPHPAAKIVGGALSSVPLAYQGYQAYKDYKRQ